MNMKTIHGVVTVITELDHQSLTDAQLKETLTEVADFQLDARDLPGPRAGLTSWVSQAPLCFRSSLRYRTHCIEIAFHPERQKAGVAAGAYTEWHLCSSEVEALRRFLNDDKVL